MPCFSDGCANSLDVFDVRRINERSDVSCLCHFFIHHASVGEKHVAEKPIVCVTSADVGLDCDLGADGCDLFQLVERLVTISTLSELGRVDHEKPDPAGLPAIHGIPIGDAGYGAGNAGTRPRLSLLSGRWGSLGGEILRNAVRTGKDGEKGGGYFEGHGVRAI